MRVTRCPWIPARARGTLLCPCDHVLYRLEPKGSDTADGLLMITTRITLFMLALAFVLNGCGDSAMSLTEYTEHINAVEIRASERGTALAVQAEKTVDFTPQDLQAVLEGARAIRIEVKEATDDIRPPDQVADIHNLVFDWHTEFIAIEEEKG